MSLSVTKSRKATTSTRTVALITCGLLLGGCVPEEESPAEPKTEQVDEFEESLAELQGEFAGDRKDDIPLVRNPCIYLKKFTDEEGNILPKVGFFIGMEGKGVLGPATGFGGFDLVFDVYHHEMTVSKYYGAGVALSGGAELGLEYYAGIARGFQKSVADWDGYFRTTNLQIGLPFLKEFIHLAPGYFVSTDRSGRVVEGPEGVKIGISAGIGIDPILGISPVKGDHTLGKWTTYDEAVQWAYDDLSSRRIAGIWKIKVERINPKTKEVCEEDEKHCVLRFGDDDMSHVKRSLHTAAGLCALTQSCLLPGSLQMAAGSLAIGLLRDSNLNYENYCGDLD